MNHQKWMIPTWFRMYEGGTGYRGVSKDQMDEIARLVFTLCVPRRAARLGKLTL